MVDMRTFAGRSWRGESVSISACHGRIHVRGEHTGALSGMNRSPMTSTRREVILEPALELNDPFPRKTARRKRSRSSGRSAGLYLAGEAQRRRRTV